MEQVSANVSSDPSLLDVKRWRSSKAANNRYEAWDKDGKCGSRNKLSDDKWEFPRYRLKVRYYTQMNIHQ